MLFSESDRVSFAGVRALLCAWWVLTWSAWASAQEPAAGFQTVLVSDAQWVAVRQAAGGDGAARQVWLEVRLAEPTPEGMRLESEWLVAMDCARQPVAMGVWRQLHNGQPANQPVRWDTVQEFRRTSGSAGPVFRPVQPVWDLEPGQPPEQLQLPTHWQAAAAYACSPAEWPATQRAAWVGKTAGLADLETWDCPITDRSGAQAGKAELAYSPGTGVARINDKWVAQGLLAPSYLAFAQDGVDIRFMRQTGVLRLVRRDEMQNLGTARCVRVGAGAVRSAKPTGW